MKTRTLFVFASALFLNVAAFAAPAKNLDGVLRDTKCLNHWQELSGSIYSQIQEKVIPEVNTQIIETIQEAIFNEYYATYFLGHGRTRKDVVVQTSYEIQAQTNGFYLSFVAETLLPNQKPLRAAYSIHVEYGLLNKAYDYTFSLYGPIPFPYEYSLAVATEQSEAPGLYKSMRAPVVNGVGNITRSAGVECVLAANVQHVTNTYGGRHLKNIDSQQNFGYSIKQSTHFLISTLFIPAQ